MGKSPIRAISHVTFAVSNLDKSVAFYRNVLGFSVVATWRHGAYVRIDDVWLELRCSAERKEPLKRLFTGSLKPSSIAHADTHVAFLVSGEEFGALNERITDSGATVRTENTEVGPVLYFGDPDGHKLEIHVARMEERVRAARDSSDNALRFVDQEEGEANDVEGLDAKTLID